MNLFLTNIERKSQENEIEHSDLSKNCYTNYTAAR